MVRIWSKDKVEQSRLAQQLMFVARLALFTSLFAVISGCGKLDLQIIDLTVKTPDFLKTEIISNGPGVADGLSELLVVVQLKNSDLSVVAGYRPTYTITSGSGVITSECTESLSNGLSYCILKSTQAGVKRLKLTNARQGLEKEVVFDPKKSHDVMGIIAGSLQKGTTASGYRVESSTGGLVKELKTTTSDGYVMFTNVQGALISRE